MNQLQILKKLSGQKRLQQAFFLSDFVRELAIRNIKDQLGRNVSRKEVLKKLKQRILYD